MSFSFLVRFGEEINVCEPSDFAFEHKHIDYKQNERNPCECGELLGPGGVAYAVKFLFFQRVEFAFKVFLGR